MIFRVISYCFHYMILYQLAFICFLDHSLFI